MTTLTLESLFSFLDQYTVRDINRSTIRGLIASVSAFGHQFYLIKTDTRYCLLNIFSPREDSQFIILPTWGASPIEALNLHFQNAGGADNPIFKELNSRLGDSE